MRPKGILLGPGPGDPQRRRDIVEQVRAMAGSGVPVMGVGAGHQFLGLALGGKIRKLRPGHHGGNQPVREIGRAQSLITAQSHSFAVEVSDAAACTVTHVNLNDKTVEGIESKGDPKVFSVQFMPQRDDHGKPDRLLQRFVEYLR